VKHPISDSLVTGHSNSSAAIDHDPRRNAFVEYARLRDGRGGDFAIATFSAMLLATYQGFVGCPLLPAAIPESDAARWLYEDAPFCVLAHNTDADPRFVYANRAAQRCFEYNWEEFTSLPSRLSAEAPNREERQRLLDAVTRNGFATGYRGLRVAKSGRQFWIEDGIVWQLVDASGARHGQAATFSTWRDA
jgi:MEKHLA domain